MAKYLFILKGPAYGTETSSNGLRLAESVSRHAGIVSHSVDNEVRVFLIGDAVACAKRGQAVPHGHCNLEKQLHSILKHQGQVGVCGYSMDIRGFSDADIVEGCHRSTMDELSVLTDWSDKILVF